jgi:hypothetical protein
MCLDPICSIRILYPLVPLSLRLVSYYSLSQILRSLACSSLESHQLLVHIVVPEPIYPRLPIDVGRQYTAFGFGGLCVGRSSPVPCNVVLGRVGLKVK